MKNPAEEEADRELADRLGLDINGRPDDPLKTAIDKVVPKATTPMRNTGHIERKYDTDQS